MGIKHLSDKEEMPFECLGALSYKEVNVLRYRLTTLRKKKVARKGKFNPPK